MASDWTLGSCVEKVGYGTAVVIVLLVSLVVLHPGKSTHAKRGASRAGKRPTQAWRLLSLEHNECDFRCTQCFRQNDDNNLL
jgi:hypothetical protein